MPISNMGMPTDVLASIGNIQRRIAEIQRRFAIPVGRQFNEYLAQSIKSNQQAKTLDSDDSITSGATAQSERSNQTTALHSGYRQYPSAQIDNFIKQAASKYGVDAKLVSAIAEVESNYHSDAVSNVGAVGVMQLMPSTAASLGVHNPYDAKENIEGGTKYIKQLLGDFNGDVSKAVAAYNAGPAAVKKYKGIPPYAETRNYVTKVLDLYR